MMRVLIQHDFLFVVTYQSVINCLTVHTITVSFFSISKNYISTCHCHLSSRFLILTAQGESNLADELCKIISKAQSLNIIDFFNAK